jgi:hypothetical protein
MFAKSNSIRRLGQRDRPRLSFEFLARRSKFDDISKHLKEDKMEDYVLISWLNEGCTGSETALHKLLRYRPPTTLVDLLAQKLTKLNASSLEEMTPALNDKGQSPTPCLTMDFVGEMENLGKTAPQQSRVLIPEEARDDQGRTPLHIAAAFGSHVKVIDRLLEGETCAMPALSKDDYGRYPLHWACTNPTEEVQTLLRSGSSRSLLFRGFSSRRLVTSASTKAATSPETIDNTCRVICRLIDVFPEALTMPDDDGLTPLALAKRSKVNTTVLKLLRTVLKMYKYYKGSGESGDSTYPDSTEDDEIMPLEVSHSTDANFDDISSLGVDDLPKKQVCEPRRALVLSRITL